jgi:hypothetical protein
MLRLEQLCIATSTSGRGPLAWGTSAWIFVQTQQAGPKGSASRCSLCPTCTKVCSDGSCDELSIPFGYSSDCCHGQRIFTVMICPLDPCTSTSSIPPRGSKRALHSFLVSRRALCQLIMGGQPYLYSAPQSVDCKQRDTRSCA